MKREKARYIFFISIFALKIYLLCRSDSIDAPMNQKYEILAKTCHGYFSIFCDVYWDLTFCRLVQHHVRFQSYIKQFEKSEYGAIISWIKHLLLLYLAKSHEEKEKMKLIFYEILQTLFRRHFESFLSWMCSAWLEWNILFHVLSVRRRTSKSRQTLALGAGFR